MSQSKVLPVKITAAQMGIQFPVFSRTHGSLLFSPHPDSHPLT